MRAGFSLGWATEDVRSTPAPTGDHRCLLPGHPEPHDRVSSRGREVESRVSSGTVGASRDGTVGDKGSRPHKRVVVSGVRMGNKSGGGGPSGGVSP